MKQTYIIGEMAWSHNGVLDNAIKIIRGLKESGANAVSIHITDLETYMVSDYKCLAGQTLSESADNQISIYDYLSKINLSNEDWLNFSKEALDINIDVIAMCNDLASFEFSKKLNVKKYVLSAASFNELNLIESIIRYNNNIILRIGGATLEEIDNVVRFILNIDPETNINILAGIQLYPTPVDQMHIASIITLKERFKNNSVTLGLADHIDGDDPYAIYLPGLAVAIGAEVLEKHITTDRIYKLEDYEAALGVEQFKDFVRYIRTVEKSLGKKDLDYLTNDSYQRYRNISRKKIVAKSDIKKGEIITEDNITFKRSDIGLPLEKMREIIGKRAVDFIHKDEGVTPEKVI